MTRTKTLNRRKRNAVSFFPFSPPQNILSRAHGVRALGSACMNMVMVAGGNADAYQEFGLHCWDIAAGKIIVEEAGGVVCDLNGECVRVCVCVYYLCMRRPLHL